jgi:hypothetical protein
VAAFRGVVERRVQRLFKALGEAGHSGGLSLGTRGPGPAGGSRTIGRLCGQNLNGQTRRLGPI